MFTISEFYVLHESVGRRLLKIIADKHTFKRRSSFIKFIFQTEIRNEKK